MLLVNFRLDVDLKFAAFLLDSLTILLLFYVSSSSDTIQWNEYNFWWLIFMFVLSCSGCALTRASPSPPTLSLSCVFRWWFFDGCCWIVCFDTYELSAAMFAVKLVMFLKFSLLPNSFLFLFFVLIWLSVAVLCYFLCFSFLINYLSCLVRKISR